MSCSLLGIADRGIGLWCCGMGCRLTSWIALRSALGISMIAIYLPTTRVMCFGSEDRDTRRGGQSVVVAMGGNDFSESATGCQVPSCAALFERVSTFLFRRRDGATKLRALEILGGGRADGAGLLRHLAYIGGRVGRWLDPAWLVTPFPLASGLWLLPSNNPLIASARQGILIA